MCQKQNDRYIMPDYVQSDNDLQLGYQTDGGGGWLGTPSSQGPPVVSHITP